MTRGVYSGTDTSQPASLETSPLTVVAWSRKWMRIECAAPIATVQRAWPFASVNRMVDPAIYPSDAAPARARDGAERKGFSCGSSSARRSDNGRPVMCPTTVMDSVALSVGAGVCARLGAVGEPLQAAPSTNAAAIRMVRIPMTIRKGSR